MKSEPEKKEGARLRAPNRVIFSTAGSTASIQDDVCEPSDAKIGNIWKMISQHKWRQIKKRRLQTFSLIYKMQGCTIESTSIMKHR